MYLISNKDYGMSRAVAQMAGYEPRIASLLLQLVPVAQMRTSQVSAKLSYSKNRREVGVRLWSTPDLMDARKPLIIFLPRLHASSS